NVRHGRILLPTHATTLDNAVSIFDRGKFDPKQTKGGRVCFRYGLGHSYGEIVFVHRPAMEDLGRLHDIHGIMDGIGHPREELAKLVEKLTYNHRVPVKGWGASFLGDTRGRSVRADHVAAKGFMERFPQFEPTQADPIDNIYLVLAPEHLYPELIR